MPTCSKILVVLLCIGGMTQAKARTNPASASVQQSSTTPTAEDKKSESQTESKPPRPNPDSFGIYHAGAGVTPPKIIFTVEPEFSEKARKKKISGNCVVSLIVATNGTATDIHVVRSIADTVPIKQHEAALELDQNAVKVVSQYRFTPATYRGTPVPYRLNVEVNYQIF